MSILLLGRNGQLGFELRRALAPVGPVVAVGRQECNLADAEALQALVRQVRPCVIVNAGAYTAVDRAESEPDLAHQVNAVAPQILAEEAARLEALLVHYSTDYVFDGTKAGAYLETDTPNPVNVYGASKLAGEEAIQASGARHLIFRTSWVVGAHGGNFLKTMLRLAADRPALRVVADQTGAPTSAALIADVTAHAICALAGNAGAGLQKGVYHLAASGETTWHGYARHVIARAREAGRPLVATPEAVEPIETSAYPTPARRPANSRLDTRKLREAFGVTLPDWREGVDYILDQILQEPTL